MVTRAPKNWGDLESRAAEDRTRDRHARRAMLLAKLRELCGLGDVGDPEYAHAEADRLLLDFIDDDEVRAAFEAVPRWYA